VENVKKVVFPLIAFENNIWDDQLEVNLRARRDMAQRYVFELRLQLISAR